MDPSRDISINSNSNNYINNGNFFKFGNYNGQGSNVIGHGNVVHTGGHGGTSYVNGWIGNDRDGWERYDPNNPRHKEFMDNVHKSVDKTMAGVQQMTDDLSRNMTEMRTNMLRNRTEISNNMANMVSSPVPPRA
jgi:hypothetical protein